MIDDTAEFDRHKAEMAERMAADAGLQSHMREVLVSLDRYDYTYQATWFGLPIIQSPSDIVAQQEIIWASRPTVIIETGVARGGSMIFLASMLKLVGGRKVVGIDIDVRSHNRARIEAHPLGGLVALIEGSSTETTVLDRVRALLRPDDRVMVILDSDHRSAHVRDELALYAPLVTPGQYMVVADTIVDLIPPQHHRPRPWGPGDNPMTAALEFRSSHPEFELDQTLDAKLALSCNPQGYFRRRPG